MRVTHADYQHTLQARVQDIAERKPDFRRDILAHAGAFGFFWSLHLDPAQEV